LSAKVKIHTLLEEIMPQGFQIGPIFIYYYGIFLMVGALAGAILAAYEVRRRGLDPELVWDGLVWVLVGGIIGARIWHILTPPPSMVEHGITTLYYLTHPLDAINIRSGGLGIPGGVIGGGLAMYWFSRRRKLDFLVWADIAVPALALGQAIGRWGNFFNQELYGKPTSLPWAIRIDPEYRLLGYENYETFHPTFLYESLWNFANMFLLLWLSRRYKGRLKSGDILLVYMMVYPIGRILMEFLRLDSPQMAGINTNQTIMLIVTLVAGGLLFWRHRADTRIPPPSDSEVQEKASQDVEVEDEAGESLTSNEEKAT
jgi:phosphatidylglycerol:prolipoprotein diacylglycerol transferase